MDTMSLSDGRCVPEPVTLICLWIESINVSNFFNGTTYEQLG